jgi:hypothetical protein
MHRGFRLGDLKDGRHLDSRRRWEDNIKVDHQYIQ